jgi:hypothetical protein
LEDPRRQSAYHAAIACAIRRRVARRLLEHLERLTQLQRLELEDTQVTDAGLKHLEGLTQLHYLSLSGTQVTDAGREHLKALKQLRWLHLAWTHCTDAGMKKFEQAMPDCNACGPVNQ